MWKKNLLFTFKSVNYKKVINFNRDFLKCAFQKIAVSFFINLGLFLIKKIYFDSNKIYYIKI